MEYKQGVPKERKTSGADKSKSFNAPMSVFNVMNAVLGSGILGLANAVANIGVVLFTVFLVGVAVLAYTTITFLLELSQQTDCTSYEKIGKRAFGKVGKLVTACSILVQCVGGACSFLFIVKYNLPGVIRSLAGINDCYNAWYLNGDYLVILITVTIVVPLSSLKNIGKLSYTSAFAQACMLFFTVMVIVKKFYIPCPILNDDMIKSNSSIESYEQARYNSSTKWSSTNYTSEECNATLSNDMILEELKSSLKTQTCKVDPFVWNSNSVYAVPTMIFSFQCHSSLLHIYSDLRNPTVRRMKSVVGVSLLACLASYMLAAIFGYLTFYNATGAELLFMYSADDPDNVVVVIARLMVILMAIFTVPLNHFPARKAFNEIFFGKKPFSWTRHLSVMVLLLVTTNLLVIFLPSIRDVFGIAGASAASLLVIILPSLFYVKLIPTPGTSSKKILAYFYILGGFLFMGYSMSLMIMKWIKN